MGVTMGKLRAVNCYVPLEVLAALDEESSRQMRSRANLVGKYIRDGLRNDSEALRYREEASNGQREQG